MKIIQFLFYLAKKLQAKNTAAAMSIHYQALLVGKILLGDKFCMYKEEMVTTPKVIFTSALRETIIGNAFCLGCYPACPKGWGWTTWSSHWIQDSYCLDEVYFTISFL